MTTYPTSRKSNVSDEIHGIKVPDPYRWLEDLDSEETCKWIEEQNKVTFEVLEKIPEREKIRERLTQLWDYEKFGVPHREGNRYFFSKNDGLQNQSVLYTSDSLRDKPRVLLDPNQLSPDGTIALAGYSISDGGNLMAYGLSASGSDWMEWKVRDVATGKDLDDVLKWIKFSSAAWKKDSSGFFYSRYLEPANAEAMDETLYFQKLYFHRLGTAQSDDELVYERPDEREWHFYPYVTEDGRYLIVTVSRGTAPRYAIYYRDLQIPDSKLTELIGGFDAEYSFIGNEQHRFWFKTNLNAPRGRIVEIDLQNPDRKFWKEIIPESTDTLESAGILNHQIIATYLKDAHSAVKIFELDGRFVQDVQLPGTGTIGGFSGKQSDTETYFAFTSFATPTQIYQYDLVNKESSLLWAPKLNFNPDDYQTDQVFYHSKDSTQVPMFIVHKKGIERNGLNKTYLYGYGGFNISLTPAFSVSALVWMELGGVYAVANLRGGGEYGEEWHRAGTVQNKQNVFDDFIAAAEWLIQNEYTRPESLAIGGGSNGGLLVAASMIQRPDLFGAVMPSVGVLDMLRFHKFTIGWAWIDDYGNPDNHEHFKAIYKYSPLHNIKPAKYPAVLLSTADHDDRVVPLHSFKFAAALQEVQRGTTPVLIRIDVKAGHGIGKPTSKLIDEITDKWSFLTATLR
ncbi:prolyl oligopeptidase family serine peptidase [bacterium]|nr:prolyl oligopeptidase family serine peptidase [bacterium]